MQTLIDAGAPVEAQQEVQLQIDTKLAEQQTALTGADSEYTKTVNELFDGIGKAYPEAAKGLENIVKDYDILSIINSGFDSAENGGEGFTPEIYKKLFPDIDPSTLNVTWIEGLRDEVVARLSENLGSEKLAPAFDVFSAALDTGLIDPINVTKATGALEGIFSAIDLKANGMEIGKGISDGTASGIEDNAAQPRMQKETQVRH